MPSVPNGLELLKYRLGKLAEKVNLARTESASLKKEYLDANPGELSVEECLILGVCRVCRGGFDSPFYSGPDECAHQWCMNGPNYKKPCKVRKG